MRASAFARSPSDSPVQGAEFEVERARARAELCGVWCVVCGVWSVECGVRCVVCGVWCVVCGVWCVVCGAWCVGRRVQGVWYWRLTVKEVGGDLARDLRAAKTGEGRGSNPPNPKPSKQKQWGGFKSDRQRGRFE